MSWPSVPLYESMTITDATIAENIEQRLTNILWPLGNTSFSSTFVSKTLNSFSELASGLVKTIKRMILESFGLEKYMDELMDFTNHTLKFIKYKVPDGEPIVGMPSHRIVKWSIVSSKSSCNNDEELGKVQHQNVSMPEWRLPSKGSRKVVDEANPLLFKPFDYEEFA
ncbi:hypothetical protein REPUB_Repub13aG0180600 [Reevesia pubescens]